MSFEYAAAQIAKDYENGEISEEEYLKNMRDIREEAQEAGYQED